MTDFQALYYEMRFTIQFLEAKGLAFQALFNSIMSALHLADFMPCRPWGAIGDRKNDGYLKSERILFQVYAPNEMSLTETIGKIERDFAAALPYWRPYLDSWIFVHNSREGLAPDVIEKLLALGRDHSPLKVGQWGYDELLDRFRRLSSESLQSLYGPAPDGRDRSRGVLAWHLRRLIEELACLPLAPMEQGIAATGAAVRLKLQAQVNGLGKVVEAPVRHSDLREAMTLNPRLIIVGPGGSGKTTALSRTAFEHACELAADPALGADTEWPGTVPVLLRLSSYSGSLVETLATRLLTDVRTADALLREGRIVLYLDDFDQLTQKRRLVEELEQLVRLVPSARYVLATRPDAALGAVGPLIGVRYDFAPLGDVELASLLALHLGAEGAEALLKGLQEQHLVDAFRLPLMAWLATVEFRESGAAPRSAARGVIFQRILDHLFLKWGPRRREGLVDHSGDLKVECIESLACEMVRRNAVALTKREAERVFQSVVRRSGEAVSVDPAQLLKEVASEPLLDDSSGALEFRHLSLRDHLAAAWLARRAGPWKTALLCRYARWHEPLIHLVGILDERRTRALLQLLVKLTPVAVLGCSIDSMRWSADWIFLVIRCLVETPQPVDDLRDKFLEQIRHKAGGATFWLDRASYRASFSLHGHELYLAFDSLIGRLGTRSTFEYVRSRANRQSRIAGVAQFRNEEGAAALFAEFEESSEVHDTIGDVMAAGWLLRLPGCLLLSKGEELLQEAKPAVKKRFLESLVMAMAWENAMPRDFGRWTPLLVAAVLADDRTVAGAALSFLRRGGGLAVDAERLLLDALAGDEGERRYLAIWPLVYSRSAESLEALVATLGDQEFPFGLRALDALRIRDDEHFADHVVALLKRHAPGGVEQSIASIVSSIGETWTNSDPSAVEKYVWLASGACAPVDEALRGFCVRGLGSIAMDTSPILIRVLQDDSSPEVRSNAVGSLASVLGNDAAPYLLRGLNDADPGVREMSGHCCRLLTGKAAETVLPLLRSLSTESVTIKVAADFLARSLNTTGESA